MNVEFESKLNLLKKVIISYHDKKARSESFVNEDYLTYLSYKYASKSYKDICENQDIEALDLILANVKEKPQETK